METATTCPIRRSDNFRRALGQMTGGILDYSIRSGMFVIDQSSVQELFNLRSDSMTTPKKKVVEDLSVCVPKKLQHWEAVDGFW